MKTKRHLSLIISTVTLLMALVEAHLATLQNHSEAKATLTTTHNSELHLTIDTLQRAVVVSFEPEGNIPARTLFTTRVNGVDQPRLFRFSDHEWLEDPQAMAELLLAHIRPHLVSEA